MHESNRTDWTDELYLVDRMWYVSGDKRFFAAQQRAIRSLFHRLKGIQFTNTEQSASSRFSKIVAGIGV